jgi:hypothetical protein
VGNGEEDVVGGVGDASFSFLASASRGQFTFQ